MKTLNAAIHHEMLTPLQTNVELSNILMAKCKAQIEYDLAQTINTSSKMLILHTQDLLDQRIIELGTFQPSNNYSSLDEAISEMIFMVQLTLTNRDIKIEN